MSGDDSIERDTNGSVHVRCFFDKKPLMVPAYVFDERGFIKREYWGRTLEGGVKTGVFAFYCRGCYEEFCGPRPEVQEQREPE